MYSDVGFKIKHPDLYYGQEQFEYAIVPNKLDVVGIIAGSDPALKEAYHGEGGIPINTIFRKALVSFYLKDEKIFFSSNINDDSKLKIVGILMIALRS